MRPRSAPPISDEYRAQIEAKRPQVYQTAREQYGEEMNPGPFGIDSRPALIGVQYARTLGLDDEFHAAVLDAYWRRAEKIDEQDVLLDLAERVGMDRDEFERALENPVYEAGVDGDIQQAFQFGLQGVPALVIENRYLIPGAVPYPTLKEIVTKVHEEIVELDE